MLIVKHRINTIKELQDTSDVLGVEIDLRTFNKDLILEHDPFKQGPKFIDWISYFRHKFLIINVKEDGLEESILDILKINNINNFFFLDQSIPSLIKYANNGLRSISVRVSEFESVSDAVMLKDLIDWVWVDQFNILNLSLKEIKSLKDNGFKLCLVSPELQGRNNDLDVKSLYNHFYSNGIIIDAVCTKKVSLWASFENENK
jgi:hypothetical protein